MEEIKSNLSSSSHSSPTEESPVDHSSESEQDGFDMIKEASTLPKSTGPVLANQQSTASGLLQSASNAVKTLLLHPTREIDLNNLKKEAPRELINRLNNVWDKGLDSANRARLSDDTTNRLLQENGILKFEPQKNTFSSTSEKMHYVEPVAGPGTTEEIERISGDYGIIHRLTDALKNNPQKTIATTYIIPGTLENHIVSIYIKNGTLHYFDPKGNGAPKELQQALLDFSTTRELGYEENKVPFQQDTMNCGFCSAYILEQLHHGDDPMLEPSVEWIEGVKKAWSDKILTKYLEPVATKPIAQEKKGLLSWFGF